jgi:hypothetical protein
MSASAAAPRPPVAGDPRAVTNFLRAVLAALTLRRFLTAEAIGQSVNALRYVEMGTPRGLPQFWLDTALNTMAAFLVLLAALCAAEAVKRGARALRAYSWALVTAGCCIALIMGYARDVLDLHVDFGTASATLHPWLEFGLDVTNIFVFGGVSMVVYHNRRMVEKILDGVRATELRRLRLEQQLTESRLAAARAQIDPRRLFESLAGIRSLYQTAPEEGDEALNTLIEELRQRRAASLVRPFEP